MSVIRYVIMAAAAALLSGCGVSPSGFASGQEVLRGSPSVRADFVRECNRRISRHPLRTRQALAKVMNVSLASTPSVYCRRVTNGIVSGRLTYADINARPPTARAIRVLQGR